MALKALQVRLSEEPGRDRVVGRLAEQRGRVYFEYDPAFLRDPLWLSPFKLPPAPGLIEHRERDFGPLFGLFDDSLPDGWGLLLMDRYLRQRGSALKELSPLDRLAYLGTRTMGALTYHPPTGEAHKAPQTLDLAVMARASQEILQGEAAEVLPQLLRAGGSPGGARPKVLIGVREDTILSGEDDLPSGFAAWLVKFRGPQDSTHIGAIEQAYAQMAKKIGINMPPTRLFRTQENTGERYFGVERFDREANRRFHIQTFGNLIHADYRLPSSDYEQLLEVTRILTRNHQDVLEAYRRMIFNVLTHNRDDHVKNFAFRLIPPKGWQLAPAYDLTYASGPGGEHTMSVAGEGRQPGKRHLLQVAASAGVALQEAENILDEVATGVEQWAEFAREAEVGRPETEEIGRAIKSCLANL